jgi:hypothetical protein
MSHYKKRGYKKSGQMRKPKYYESTKCLSSLELYPMEQEFFQIALIDPGTTSCGIRIVRYYLTTRVMKVMWFSTVNFGSEIEKINTNMESSFKDIFDILTDCHHIVVEHQLLKCEKVYQCFSNMVYYIVNNICNIRMKPMLIEIDCGLKTTFIGGPRTKLQNDGIAIKEWSKKKAREVCLERGDLISYHILENSNYKQNEDLSDTVCYEYAWIKYIITRSDIFCPFDKKIFFK